MSVDSLVQKGKDAEWIPMFIEAARREKIVAGSPVPKMWIEGVQYSLSAQHRFQNNEVVVVGRSDGSRSLGRVKPPKHKSQDWFQLDLGRSPEYYIEVGAEPGGKMLHKTVEAVGLGKLHHGLLETITKSAEGTEEEDLVLMMDAAREKLVKKYNHTQHHHEG